MIVDRFVEVLNKLQKNPVSRLYKHELAPIAIELLKLEIAEEKKEVKEEKKGKK